MKGVRKYCLLLVLFFASSCGHSDEEIIMSVSSNFLTYYLNINYLDAVSYCTDDLAEEMLELFNEYDEECDEVKQRISDASKGSTFEIATIDIQDNQSRAVITYNLFPPNSDKYFIKHIVLSKNNTIWKVSSID